MGGVVHQNGQGVHPGADDNYRNKIDYGVKVPVAQVHGRQDNCPIEGHGGGVFHWLSLEQRLKGLRIEVQVRGRCSMLCHDL